jgi:hypothetical protein
VSWKKFLKPNQEKIVIIISLGILYFVIGTFYFSNCLGVSSSLAKFVPPNYCKFLSPFVVFLGLPVINFRAIGLESFQMVLSLILLIIYWYFLSCLIIWIYNKAKR